MCEGILEGIVLSESREAFLKKYPQNFLKKSLQEKKINERISVRQKSFEKIGKNFRLFLKEHQEQLRKKSWRF